MQHLLHTHPHNPSTAHANPSGNKTGSNGARLIATSATAKTAAMTETTPSAAMNAHSASQTRHSNLMAIAPTATSPATPYRW